MQTSHNAPQNSTRSRDMLPALQKKYATWLNPDIQAVYIYRKNQIVGLEVVTQTDLGFIAGDPDLEGKMFPPSSTAQENADRFVNEMDPYSIINTTDLFTKTACDEICAEYNNEQNPKGRP